MPELPEVETMVRGIRRIVEGRTISRMRLPKCDCRPIQIRPDFAGFRSQVRNRRIVQVARRAKRCLLHLDSGHAIVIEPRMTGLMLLSDPPDSGHLRVEWILSDPKGKSPLDKEKAPGRRPGASGGTRDSDLNTTVPRSCSETIMQQKRASFQYSRKCDYSLSPSATKASLARIRIERGSARNTSRAEGELSR